MRPKIQEPPVGIEPTPFVLHEAKALAVPRVHDPAADFKVTTAPYDHGASV